MVTFSFHQSKEIKTSLGRKVYVYFTGKETEILTRGFQANSDKLMIYVEINVELFKSSAMIGMFVYLLKSC
jgi:hypothetical protein